MARPLRLEYPGAVYHVMARGHERSAIFREDGDRQKFCALLSAVVGDERWQVHGHCLMGNQYRPPPHGPAADALRDTRPESVESIVRCLATCRRNPRRYLPIFSDSNMISAGSSNFESGNRVWDLEGGM